MNPPPVANPPPDFELILCDEDDEVLTAWSRLFHEKPEIEIRRADVLTVTDVDALFLPGNSFGYLDSGLELRVSELMGLAIQDQLREKIRGEFNGELLVGQSILERFAPPALPIVYAPLWRVPQDISETVNVFLATRAAFLDLTKDPGLPPLRRIAVPSLGVETGQVNPWISARQFRYGYQVGTGRRKSGAKNLTRIIRRDRKLKSLPGEARREAIEDESGDRTADGGEI